MIEKKTMPVAPFRGLYLDGPTVPGGLSKAENVIILANGTAERRPFERTLADTEACVASRGTKEVFELLKNDGTRYIFADIDNSETTTTAFGVELIDNFASWTDPGAAWGYGSSIWTHVTGTTALTAIVGATPDVLPVISTQYQIVVDVTCPTPTPTSTTAYWTLTRVDSGQTYVTKTGSTQKIWVNTWTHTTDATLATTPLTVPDFTPAIGASYVVSVYATHTSGTGLVVALGGITLGTIASTGTHEFVARYCTSVAKLTFTPSTNWSGSISKSWPRVPSKVANWISVKKFIDPAGPNIPSNYDTSAGTYTPKSSYADGAELLYYTPANWYAAATIYTGQSLTVSMGGVTQTAITASGIYTYDMTAATTDSLAFTPTTAWGGSLNACSVRAKTQSSAVNKTKVIGGIVTGTINYEVTWANILTDLTSGDSVHPCWTALQDRAFRVDGTNRNYWFENSTTYHTLGCPAPDDAPTTANATTTGGEIVAGTYNVYYTYVKKYGSGTSQYVVEGNPSPASNVTVTNDSITCAVIACTETDVTHIRIYRTIYSETGGKAYRTEEVANATATITLLRPDDEIRDSTLELEFNHDMPPQGKFVLGAGSRLWLIDTNGILHWSILDQPELMPSANYQTFDPKDGDVMMGLCPLRKHILVFKRRRTWLLDMFSETVDDNGTAALSKDVVSSNIGCVASGSIQPVGSDSAIWLSHAGFMLYNGGAIKNISGGDAETPSRIQTLINDYMADGAEHFIDSVYHSGRQLYHVNLLTRNSAGTAITGQRHLVYNMQTDSWTEYVYRNSAGTKMYETNFALAHDSLGNETILIPYISGTTGEITYIYQGEYELAVSSTTQTKILDSAGTGGTALDGPLFSIVDSSDNVYIIPGPDSFPNIFKVTSAGVKSVLVPKATIYTTIGVASITSFGVSDCVSDITHDCFYIRGNFLASGVSVIGSCIIKVTTAGACTLIVEEHSSYCAVGGGTIKGMAINSAGTSLFYIKLGIDIFGGITSEKLHRVTNPGAGQTDEEYYTFSTFNPIAGVTVDCYMSVYGNNLYLASYNIAGYYRVDKFTGAVGSAAAISNIINNVGISTTETIYGFIATSDTKMYWLDYSYVYYSGLRLIKLEYSGGAWGTTYVISIPDATPTRPGFMINSSGNFTICVSDSAPQVYIYDSSYNLTTPISVTTLNGSAGLSHLTGVSPEYAGENIFIVCGYVSDDVWKIGASTLTIGDTEPAMKNTIAHIVSNYEDLGMNQDKRLSRAYLDIDCKWQGCGSFSLEPSYEVNYYTHVDAETSQPSGSVSMRPFYHPGHQSWTYTNSAFDSDVEQWFPLRLDVGTKGNKFRYAIRAGDVTADVTGIMRIKPPRLEVQILGKSGKDD